MSEDDDAEHADRHRVALSCMAGTELRKGKWGARLTGRSGSRGHKSAAEALRSCESDSKAGKRQVLGHGKRRRHKYR